MPRGPLLVSEVLRVALAVANAEERRGGSTLVAEELLVLV